MLSFARRGLGWLSSVVVSAACAFAGTAAGQSPFRDISFVEAGRLSAERELPVMLYFEVGWARTVRRMEQTTWQEPALIDLVNEKTIPVRVDGEAQTTLVQRLNVMAYPTMMLLNADGTMIARPLVGYRDAGEVVDWMAAALGFEGTGRGSSRVALASRLPATIESALALSQTDDLADAGEGLRFLWLNMDTKEPALAALRRTLVARAIRDVASRHEPTREAFAALRERAEAGLRRQESWQELRDWVALGYALGENRELVEWTRERLASDGGLAVVRRLSVELVPVLLEERELELLSAVQPDGWSWVKRAFGWTEALDAGNLQRLTQRLQSERLLAASAMYGSMLSRGQEAEADAMARWVIVESGDAGLARARLIEGALAWGEPRQAHRMWVERVPANLRGALAERLEAALGGGGGDETAAGG